MKKKQGLLISIEGIDGSGKSTLRALLAQRLRGSFEVLETREPGGSKLGGALRTILQHDTVCSRAEFLLFAADRAQHFDEVIIPALTKGVLVISDRMADSSYAYQGFGRGLDLMFLETVNTWAMQHRQPDMTFYLYLDPESASARILKRNEKLTRFEQEKKDFLMRVMQGFEALAQHDPDRIKKINALLEPDQIADQAYALLQPLLAALIS